MMAWMAKGTCWTCGRGGGLDFSVCFTVAASPFYRGSFNFGVYDVISSRITIRNERNGPLPVTPPTVRATVPANRTNTLLSDLGKRTLRILFDGERDVSDAFGDIRSWLCDDECESDGCYVREEGLEVAVR